MNSIDLDRNCRICLKNNANMKPMTSSWNTTTNYNEMLDEILNDRLAPITNPPNNLCAKCELNLVATYAFIKLCRHSETVLLGKSKVPPDEHLDGVPSLCENNPIEHFVECKRDIMWNQQTKFVTIDEKPKGMYSALADDPTTDNNDVDTELEDTYSHTDNVDELVTHDEMKPKLCRGCKLVFASIREYQVHYRSVHQQQVLCPLCGKMVRQFTLDKHMTSHTKTKDHLCNACGKRFTLADNLKKHWRIHTGEKRYSCEHCNEKFVHWNSKRSHVRTVHTGEKKLVYR